METLVLKGLPAASETRTYFAFDPYQSMTSRWSSCSSSSRKSRRRSNRRLNNDFFHGANEDFISRVCAIKMAAFRQRSDQSCLACYSVANHLPGISLGRHGGSKGANLHGQLCNTSHNTALLAEECCFWLKNEERRVQSCTHIVETHQTDCGGAPPRWCRGEIA